MKVIVTGATGFIGTALCKEMINAGHQVTAIVRPNSEKKDKIPQMVKIIELSLDHLNQLDGSYDIFYHLAWNGSSGEARNDFNIQQTNITYTIEGIRAAKKCGCQRFIGAGSQAEYGMVKGTCTEETTPHPFMMYGAAKLSAYYLGKLVSDQEKISFVWPRIYSVYGPGQNQDALLSYIIKNLKNGRVPMLSSCENMWDYIYITDCTAALKLLGEHENAGGVYNVSSGNSRPLKQFVEKVRELVAPEIDLGFGAKKVDLNRTFWLQPIVKKLENLGYKNKVNFEEGIHVLMESFQ